MILNLNSLFLTVIEVDCPFDRPYQHLLALPWMPLRNFNIVDKDGHFHLFTLYIDDFQLVCVCQYQHVFRACWCPLELDGSTLHWYQLMQLVLLGVPHFEHS